MSPTLAQHISGTLFAKTASELLYLRLSCRRNRAHFREGITVERVIDPQLVVEHHVSIAEIFRHAAEGGEIAVNALLLWTRTVLDFVHERLSKRGMDDRSMVTVHRVFRRQLPVTLIAVLVDP